MPDTDIQLKIEKAVKLLDDHDLCFVHLKATDTTAHDKNPLAKSEFITKFDKTLSSFNLNNLVVGVCADHSTDSIRGEHNGDPVPVLIYSPHGRKDKVSHYNEIDVMTGGLGRISAHGYLLSILNAMDQLNNYKPSEIDLLI